MEIVEGGLLCISVGQLQILHQEEHGDQAQQVQRMQEKHLNSGPFRI